MRRIEGWTQLGGRWGVQVPLDDDPGREGEAVVVVSASTKKETRCLLDEVIGETMWGVVWATRLPRRRASVHAFRRRRSRRGGSLDEHGHPDLDEPWGPGDQEADYAFDSPL